MASMSNFGINEKYKIAENQQNKGLFMGSTCSSQGPADEKRCTSNSEVTFWPQQPETEGKTAGDTMVISRVLDPSQN